MPPRKRTTRENKPLPQRWEWHGGKLSYQIPPALAGHPAFGGRRRRITLGVSLVEAHRKWAEIQAHFDTPVKSGRIPDIALAYQQQELPTLAAKTQTDYRAALARLTGAFQEFTIHQIEPSHCYAYVDDNLDKVRQARYDIRVLSAVLSWCVMKGWMTANPLIGQLRFKHKRYNPKRNSRYTTDDDLLIFLSVLPRKWQLYILFKLKTGQSQQTILTTTRHHIKADGIEFNRRKTDTDIPMAWDDELRALVTEILALPNKVASIYLFPTRNGACYYKSDKGTASGFQSMWQRYRKKAMDSGMSAKFTEHQLRHKATSDNDLEAASKALGHKDIRTTDAIYNVKKPRVKPLGISDGMKEKKQ